MRKEDFVMDKEKNFQIKKLLASYPRKRPALPMKYQRIYVQHYKENREGKTKISALARKFERWVHIKVAEGPRGGGSGQNIGNWGRYIKSARLRASGNI